MPVYGGPVKYWDDGAWCDGIRACQDTCVCVRARGDGREHARVLHSVPDRLIFQGRCQHHHHHHHHHHHQVLAIHNLSHALPIPMSLLKQRRTCTRKASYSSLANNASHTARCRYVSRAFLFPRIAREKCTRYFRPSFATT